MKKYTITCSEEQLKLIAEAVEDWHRFLGGDCQLFYATCYIKDAADTLAARGLLRQAHKYVTPDIPHGSSYDWAGSHCPNDEQRKAIAMSYGIYRQILHHFALQHPENTWNTYLSPTLTCPEQGGLIEIKEINE